MESILLHNLKITLKILLKDQGTLKNWDQNLHDLLTEVFVKYKWSVKSCCDILFHIGM